MNHPDFKSFTGNIWLKENETLESTISSFQKDIQIWNKNVFGNIFHQIKCTKSRLLGVQKLLEDSTDSQLLNLEFKLQRELNQLLESEECI